ncbi:putative beta-glucosidase [Streptomyces sp. 769]|nr:putative beta-glucosidase [Streptomyces sp. 769]
MYTEFVYSDLAVQRTDNGPTAVVTVHNTGDRAGEGTVHAYPGVSTDATMPQVKK